MGASRQKTDLMIIPLPRTVSATGGRVPNTLQLLASVNVKDRQAPPQRNHEALSKSLTSILLNKVKLLLKHTHKLEQVCLSQH